jgi:excisionase family DNA binding protein
VLKYLQASVYGIEQMENKVDYKVFWTTKQLADLAGVSDSYIRQQIRAGAIQGQKARRDWIIPDSEAKRWLESRKND